MNITAGLHVCTVHQ